LHVLDGERGRSTTWAWAGGEGISAGGFEQAQLQRFGEDAMKAFVDACNARRLKLEKALFQLRTATGSRCCTTPPAARRWRAKR